MHRDEHLAHLAADGGRIAAIAASNPDAAVPTCPGWTVADLAEHVRTTLLFLGEAARQNTSPDLSDVHSPDVADALGRTLATLSALDADEPRWTWVKPMGGDTAQWYFRRIAQEILVHRLDAELAIGDVTDVDPALAVDGIDEFNEVFVPLSSGIADTNGETLHLHATDTEGEWLLTMRPEGITATTGHAKGDAAIRGTARDLLLMSWGRAPLGEIETFGDDEVVRRFREAPRA